MVSKRYRVLRGLVLLLVAAVCANCGVSGTVDTASETSRADRPPGLPPGFDVTFRWVADDVFDPLSAEGTFVRAYVESFLIANSGESMAWAFPGFLEASPQGIENEVLEVSSQAATNKLVGTSVFSALNRVDEGQLTRIVLCEFGFKSSLDYTSHGSFWRTYPRYSWTTVIEFSRSGKAPPAVQRGDARRPSADVFGDWKVADFEYLAVGDEYHPDMAGCNAKPRPAGVPPEAELRGIEPTPRPPEPPSPGWPANGL